MCGYNPLDEVEAAVTTAVNPIVGQAQAIYESNPAAVREAVRVSNPLTAQFTEPVIAETERMTRAATGEAAAAADAERQAAEEAAARAERERVATWQTAVRGPSRRGRASTMLTGSSGLLDGSGAARRTLIPG